MKKTAACFALCLCLTIALAARAPQQAPQPKPEDVLKNLVLVENIQPVPEKMKAGFEAITGKDSVTLLSYISSDLLEGRETATRGFELAAEYAASLFSLWKLKPAGDAPGIPAGRRALAAFGPGGSQGMSPQEKTFLQGLALKETLDGSTEISLESRAGSTVKSRIFSPGIDFAGEGVPNETVEAPVVFAGYGIIEKEIGYNDFKGLDVKGKIVLILTEAPGKNDPKSPFQLNKELKEKYFPAAPRFPFRRGGFNKLQEIDKLGPAAVLQVAAYGKDSDLFKQMSAPARPFSDERPTNEPRRRLALPGGGRMPFERFMGITISREMANAILESTGQKIEDLQKKIDAATKPASMEIPGARLSVRTVSSSKLVQCRNVLGFIEGSDPVLKNEVVVVGAHLDHLGRRGDYIFNGADDNGSGAVGVMNLARAFAANPQKPKRSVLFCLWTGEEEGLLGSRYYVRNPAFPLEKTVAYLNLDMISRPYDEAALERASRMFNIPAGKDLVKKITPADFLAVSFSAGDGLADILKEANQHVGLDLFLRESSGRSGRDMGGSDHSSFASVKIPWMFCIAAMTEDYHQTSDSVEKVSGELMEKISRLNYLAAYALADR